MLKKGLVGSLCLMLVGCGDDGGGRSALGESCAKTAECVSGLKCVALTCIDPSAPKPDIGVDASKPDAPTPDASVPDIAPTPDAPLPDVGVDTAAGPDAAIKCREPAPTACTHNDGCCPPGCNNNNDNNCAPICGNGVVEVGEICDTTIASGAGACASTCDDGKSCTTDSLQGAGTCQAKCNFAPIVPCCGNGVVETNETCDTAIASGAGACPASCSDGNACTNDVLSAAGTCQAKCSFPPATQCIDNDGCCPTGCNRATDNDCTAVCGNGVKEPGELCDKTITSGPDACPTSCNDGNSCTTDSLLSAGTCQAKCDFSPKTVCQNSDGCCPVGCALANDNDCTCHSLSFNGSSDYVAVANTADLNPGKGDFTIEGWIKKAAGSSGAVVSKRQGENYYVLHANGNPSASGSLSWWFVTSAGWVIYTSSQASIGDKWTHVTAQRQGNTVSMFINGTAVTVTKTVNSGSGNASDYDVNNTGSLELGRQPLGNYFAGKIGEVRITNAAVHSGNFTPAKTSSAQANTVALYHFNTGSGTQLTDYSTKNNHGTINGATWSNECP